MIAVLGWIDRSESERERMRRIIQLFHQRDARDELGIGAIRDSIADQMFPGTSTIQTRLRYFLFVPWIFRSLEQARAAPSTVSTRLRESETALIDALVAGNERGRGVIGVDARQDLQRLPSAIYWAGLKSWGLRRFPGSLEAYLREYGNLTRQAQGEEKPASWQQDLPEPPDVDRRQGDSIKNFSPSVAWHADRHFDPSLINTMNLVGRSVIAPLQS